jgi:hypothetical protein
MARKEPLTDERLEAIAAQEVKASLTYDRTDLSKTRQLALEFIEGKMSEWPAEVGRSSVVDMTTLDTMSWMLPSIIRLFMASENMVLAEPEHEGDEEWAKQATVGLNYDFMKRNDGYAVFYDTTFNALLHGDGIVKHWWDDTPETKTSFHSQLSEEQLETLLQPDDTGISEDGKPEEEIELIALEECIYTLEPGDEGYTDPNAGPAGGGMLGGMDQGSTPPVPPQAPAGPQDAAQPGLPLDVPSGMENAPAASQGPAMPPPDQMGGYGLPMVPQVTKKGRQLQPNEHVYYDAKIARTTRYGRLRWAAIAPENFVINKGATSLKGARLLGDREQVTRSDLIEMRFDRDKVMALGAYSNDSSEQLARDDGVTADQSDQPQDNEMMELVWLYELYMKIDVDGDGIAETVQMHYVDNGSMGSLLDWQVWEDEEVYSQIQTYRAPHRWNSNGLFTRTKDIAEIKTVLKRSTLDSLYASVNPQKVVRGRVLNPDELTTPSFGGAILMEDANGTVENLVIPFVGPDTLQMIEYLDMELEKRTGISRATTALDPEALQNTTATASQLAHDSSYAQIELVARNHAELGWKHAFTCALKLMVRHQRRKETIRVADKKYVEIDPRQWNADMSITINTGLGTGSRDRDIAVLSSVKTDQVAFAQILREAQLNGRALEMVPRIAHSLRKSAEAAGIQNVDAFYPEVTPADLQEAAKAIQQAKAQPPLEMQLKQEDAKLQMQLKDKDVQVKQQEAQINAQVQTQKEQAQMEADLQVKDKELQRDLVIADQEQAFEREKLAEESRQKELDRQQQMKIELLKIEQASVNAERQRKHDAEQGIEDRAFNASNADKDREVKKATAKQPNGKQ